jgi:hypothetical protein
VANVVANVVEPPELEEPEPVEPEPVEPEPVANVVANVVEPPELEEPEPVEPEPVEPEPVANVVANVVEPPELEEPEPVEPEPVANVVTIAPPLGRLTDWAVMLASPIGTCIKVAPSTGAASLRMTISHRSTDSVRLCADARPPKLLTHSAFLSALSRGRQFVVLASHPRKTESV